MATANHQKESKLCARRMSHAAMPNRHEQYQQSLYCGAFGCTVVHCHVSSEPISMLSLIDPSATNEPLLLISLACGGHMLLGYMVC